MTSEHITGMSNGTMKGGIAIGKNSGTVNNQSGDRSIEVNGDVGNINNGDNNKGNMTMIKGSATPSSDRKDLRSLTSSDLLEHLTKHECSDDTIKIFREKKVNGRLFVDLDDGLLKDLNITDSIEKRKLKALHADLTGQ